MISDNKCIFIKRGTPFYVGKVDIAITGIQNLECEKLKIKLGWRYKIKKDKL